MEEYIPRILDPILDKRLKAFGAVLIKGPKWCGKTTTAEQHAKSVIKLQDPDQREAYLSTANVKPSLLLKGETPRLIDEWQVAPVIWDAVRHAVDERKKKGQFILTGSTIVEDKNNEIHHSGTGRISTLKMWPMSLYESKESSGAVSLKSLFYESKSIDGAESPLTIENLIQSACRGGWPASLDINDPELELMIAQDYINIICEKDVSRVDNIKRNPTLTRLILRSYARNLCTLTKKTNMLKDIAGEAESISISTFDDYVSALEKLYVIEDIDAWCPSIRSASAIRSGKKRCFTDPSMAIASLGLNPKEIELDMRTFVFIFECMCIRDLKVYSQALGGQVAYYHDRYGLEVDIVLHLNDGKYALIECKLGSKEIEDGASHLLEMKNLIREQGLNNTQTPLRAPDQLIILTGGKMAYTRPDGVHVIPLAVLKD